jgi:hypothetical protein
MNKFMFWTPNHLEKCIIIILMYKIFSEWPIVPYFQWGLHLSKRKVQNFDLHTPLDFAAKGSEVEAEEEEEDEEEDREKSKKHTENSTSLD